MDDRCDLVRFAETVHRRISQPDIDHALIVVTIGGHRSLDIGGRYGVDTDATVGPFRRKRRCHLVHGSFGGIIGVRLNLDEVKCSISVE